MRKIVLRANGKRSAFKDTTGILDQRKQQSIFVLLFTVMYLFRDLAGANVPDIVFSGLCAVSFILMDRGTSLGVYIFTTALTVPHNEIVIVYLVISCYKMISSGKLQINGRMLIMNLGLLFLELLNLTIFSAFTINNAIYDYVTRMLIIIVPLFWYNDEYSAEDFRSALLCYVVGVVLGGTVTMILTADRTTWEVLLKGTGGIRLGRTWSVEEGMQTTYNANQLGVMFSIVAAIILNALERKHMSKLLGMSLLCYCLFIIILTRSRSATLMMALAFLIYIAIIVVRKRKVLEGLLVLAAFALGVWAITYFFPGIAERLINRFVEEEDITNGRIEVLIYFVSKWVEKPWGFFFGYGIGSFRNALETGWAPHNAITDVLISTGIVGLILISGIVQMCYKKGIRNAYKNERVMVMLPALIALIASMGGQYLDTGYSHPRLCFLLLAAKAFIQEEKAKHPQDKTGNI